MNTDTVLYLSRNDVEAVGLSMVEIIEALDSMFKEKGEGRVEMPPKPGIHTRKDAFDPKSLKLSRESRSELRRGLEVQSLRRFP